MRVTKIVCLLLFLPAVATAAAPGLPKGWSDGFVYANGARIHYYHAVPAPGKPTIVMAHGITDIGLCWTTLTQQLQADFDIYMVDARGHGLSDPFTTADRGDTLIKDLVEFVRAMGFAKPILMGHSMGAATVMRLGADYPDLAKAIVMLDPRLSPPPAVSTGAAQRPHSANTTTPANNDRRASDPLPFVMFGSPEQLVAQNNYNFDELVAKCRRQTPKWDLVDCEYWALSKLQYHGAYSPETTQALTGIREIGDALARIEVPSLILKADAPSEIRKANEEAARVMQHGTLVHIDDSGHNLHHDQLARTTEHLRTFLAQLIP